MLRDWDPGTVEKSLIFLLDGVKVGIGKHSEANAVALLVTAVFNTAANRVVKGARIEHVCGDPELGPEKDFAYGLEIVGTALRALQTPVTGPTLFEPGEASAPREAVHAS